MVAQKCNRSGSTKIFGFASVAVELSDTIVAEV